MRIFAAREIHPSEKRVALVPATVSKLIKLGAQVEIEPGLGDVLHFHNDAYTAAGATVAASRAAGLGAADLVLRLGKPSPEDIAALKPGAIHVSHLDPFNDPGLLRRLAAANVSAIAMEMIPRSTIAQKMDALSSQANLAGYVAVILGAEAMQAIFPMMTTPSGTIRPAKVFVIGVGVAGLQAIATAKRLGATVEAFDTRPAVEEQVKSLGAKFVKVDLGETGQTAQGYAKELTPEQLARQREAMAVACAQADLVITTAQVFGRRAPVIVTSEMIRRMKPASVVVDLAIDSGGNVEGAKLNEEVRAGEVTILGHGNLAGRVPRTASEMYANNLAALIDHFWDRDAKTFKLNPDADILTDCLVTHGGVIRHEKLRQLAEQAGGTT